MQLKVVNRLVIIDDVNNEFEFKQGDMVTIEAKGETQINGRICDIVDKGLKESGDRIIIDCSKEYVSDIRDIRIQNITSISKIVNEEDREND